MYLRIIHREERGKALIHWLDPSWSRVVPQVIDTPVFSDLHTHKAGNPAENQPQ